MKPTTLRVLLAWLDVLVSLVNSFDHQHVFFVIDRQDFARNGFVFAANDRYCVAGVYLHFFRRFLQWNREVSDILLELSSLNLNLTAIPGRQSSGEFLQGSQLCRQRQNSREFDPRRLF